jgi:SAM-dependent methyltransferase
MINQKKVPMPEDVATTTGQTDIFDPANVAAIYDSSAEAYSQDRSALDLFNNDHQLDQLQALIPPPARVMDLGCGEGYIPERLMSRGYEVTGVEISSEMIKKAIERVPGADFIHASMLDVDFADGSFGLVVSFYAILHLTIEDQIIMFERVFKYLKPGGYFYFTLMSSELIKEAHPEMNEPERYSGPYNFAGTVYPYAHIPHAEYLEKLSAIGFVDSSIDWIKTGVESMPWVLARKPL